MKKHSRYIKAISLIISFVFIFENVLYSYECMGSSLRAPINGYDRMTTALAIPGKPMLPRAVRKNYLSNITQDIIGSYFKIEGGKIIFIEPAENESIITDYKTINSQMQDILYETAPKDYVGAIIQKSIYDRVKDVAVLSRTAPDVYEDLKEHIEALDVYYKNMKAESKEYENISRFLASTNLLLAEIDEIEISIDIILKDEKRDADSFFDTAIGYFIDKDMEEPIEYLIQEAMSKLDNGSKDKDGIKNDILYYFNALSNINSRNIEVVFPYLIYNDKDKMFSAAVREKSRHSLSFYKNVGVDEYGKPRAHRVEVLLILRDLNKRLSPANTDDRLESDAGIAIGIELAKWINTQAELGKELAPSDTLKWTFKGVALPGFFVKQLYDNYYSYNEKDLSAGSVEDAVKKAFLRIPEEDLIDAIKPETNAWHDLRKEIIIKTQANINSPQEAFQEGMDRVLHGEDIAERQMGAAILYSILPYCSRTLKYVIEEFLCYITSNPMDFDAELRLKVFSLMHEENVFKPIHDPLVNLPDKSAGRQAVKDRHPDKNPKGVDGGDVVGAIAKGMYSPQMFEDSFTAFNNRHKEYEAEVEGLSKRPCEIFQYPISIKNGAYDIEDKIYLGKFTDKDDYFVYNVYFSEKKELKTYNKKDFTNYLNGIKWYFNVMNNLVKHDRINKLKEFFPNLNELESGQGSPQLAGLSASPATKALPLGESVYMNDFKNRDGEKLAVRLVKSAAAPGLLDDILYEDIYRLKEFDYILVNDERNYLRDYYRSVVLSMRLLESSIIAPSRHSKGPYLNSRCIKEALLNLTKGPDIGRLAGYIILFAEKDSLAIETFVKLEDIARFVKLEYGGDKEFDDAISMLSDIVNECMALKRSMEIVSDEDEMKKLKDNERDMVLSIAQDFGYEELYYSCIKNQKDNGLKARALLKIGDLVQAGHVINTKELMDLSENGRLSGIYSKKPSLADRAIGRADIDRNEEDEGSTKNLFLDKLDKKTRKYINQREISANLLREMDVDSIIDNTIKQITSFKRNEHSYEERLSEDKREAEMSQIAVETLSLIGSCSDYKVTVLSKVYDLLIDLKEKENAKTIFISRIAGEVLGRITGLDSAWPVKIQKLAIVKQLLKLASQDSELVSVLGLIGPCPEYEDEIIQTFKVKIEKIIKNYTTESTGSLDKVFRAFGQRGRFSKQALTELGNYLWHEQGEVRYAAVKGLGESGCADKHVIDELLALLNDKGRLCDGWYNQRQEKGKDKNESDMKKAIVETLTKLDSSDERILETLLDMVEYWPDEPKGNDVIVSDGNLYLSLIEGLAKIGKTNKGLKEKLKIEFNNWYSRIALSENLDLQDENKTTLYEYNSLLFFALCLSKAGYFNKDIMNVLIDVANVKYGYGTFEKYKEEVIAILGDAGCKDKRFVELLQQGLKGVTYETEKQETEQVIGEGGGSVEVSKKVVQYNLGVNALAIKYLSKIARDNPEYVPIWKNELEQSNVDKDRIEYKSYTIIFAEAGIWSEELISILKEGNDHVLAELAADSFGYIHNISVDELNTVIRVYIEIDDNSSNVVLTALVNIFNNLPEDISEPELYKEIGESWIKAFKRVSRTVKNKDPLISLRFFANLTKLINDEILKLNDEEMIRAQEYRYKHNKSDAAAHNITGVSI